MTRNDPPPRDAEWSGVDPEALLTRAARARLGPVLDAQTTVARLCNGEGDGLPGLMVDAAGPVALVQAYQERWRPRLPRLAQALAAAGWPSSRLTVRGQGGVAAGEEAFLGPPLEPERAESESGLGYLIRAADESLSVGRVPDARGARGLLRTLSRGQRVLNLFAYAGGFTVAALAGGAGQVDQVDASRKAAGWSARNVAINGFSPRGCRFVVDDAPAFCARAARRGERYGVVVLDPPTFGRSRQGRFSTAADGALLADALALVEDGGRLLFGLNTTDQAVGQLWTRVVTAAGGHAEPVLETTLGPGLDFPAPPGLPHLERFKMLVIRVHAG